MKKTVPCDLALLVLLKNSPAQEVNFLVDVLTDEGKGRAALPAALKDLLLQEKAEGHYSDAGLRYLLHELQSYGGHSAVNFFRSEPLLYAELLTDVHKKLNGQDSQTKSVQDKEREIVLSLFGDAWRMLPDRARWERCTETKVVSGFFNMRENLNFDGQGMAIGLSAAASAAAFVALRMNPVGAAIGTVALFAQSMGEAYRITIPFVTQIARIKMLKMPALGGCD